MTVAELIQILQRFDPNLKVGVYYDSMWFDLDEAEIRVVHVTDKYLARDEDSLVLFNS
jgi:hypothetical protein